MSSLDPIDIISRGLKINPRITRIAFGIPIVLASIAIGTSLFGDIVSAAYAFIGGIFSCVMVLILSIASYHIAKPGASNHWTLPIVKSLTWFCAVLFMGVCLVIFGTWASGIPFAAAISKIITNPPPTTIEGRLHFNMLPANNVAEIDKSQLEAYVARKKVDIGGTPSLRLNQAVIGVDRAADPNKIVVIYGNSIAMDGASRINANGNNVLLLARNIKFD